MWHNPIRRIELDDEFTMLIGAGLDIVIYEIGYVPGRSDGIPVIVHAMHVRSKFLSKE
ncbi:MAG: hypothetical protein ACRDPW_01210 [Mycobacteriales bacterium]